MIKNAGTEQNEKKVGETDKIKIPMITNWKDIRGKMIRMNHKQPEKKENLRRNS